MKSKKAQVKLVAVDGRVEVAMKTLDTVYISVLLPGTARRMAKQLLQMAELAEKNNGKSALVIDFKK